MPIKNQTTIVIKKNHRLYAYVLGWSSNANDLHMNWRIPKHVTTSRVILEQCSRDVCFNCSCS